MRSPKVWLGSLGFLLIFVGLGAMVWDLKSPQVQTESCLWVGRGAALSQFKQSAQVLYQQSTRPEADIGLMCPSLGPVWVNDVTSLDTAYPKTVQLTLLHYRWMPERVRLAVPLTH